MSGTLQRSRILVIDDEPKNRALAKAMLQSEYEVVDAADAIDGYEILASEPIDLVLLDVMMPAVDGFAACREIKRRFSEPFLPVLLFTAAGAAEQRHQGFESGADDFITKPVDRRELMLRVRAFLRIRKQDELIRRQLAELRRLDRMKDDLAELLTHDLRNPMTGVDGFLQLLRNPPGSGASLDQRQLVDWALVAMHDLRSTVEDMLRVRHLENDRLGAARHSTSVSTLVRRAADSQRGSAELRDLTVVVDCADELSNLDFTIAVDEALLRRAVENLMVNALRYSPPGAAVDVSVRRELPSIVIEVADRGPGMSAEDKLSLFKKYGSLEERHGKARTGNGLGLYLVKLAAVAHGGEVAVLDRAKGGTIFRLTLPIVAADSMIVPSAGLPVHESERS